MKLLSRNRDRNETENEHVYAMCCRPEVDGGVISGRNVKTVEGYVVKFEASSLSSFRDINKTRKAHKLWQPMCSQFFLAGKP